MANKQGGISMEAQGAAKIISFLPFVLVFLVFYFLLIRPQQKRQKEANDMLSKLAKGDNIITTGGIFGSIEKVKEDRLTLKISDNVRIEVMKNAVTNVIK